jgi:hypothetical protein
MKRAFCRNPERIAAGAEPKDLILNFGNSGDFGNLPVPYWYSTELVSVFCLARPDLQ